MSHRQIRPLDPDEQSMTERYCKNEFVTILAHHLSWYLSLFGILHAFVYFSPNAYQLPFNCYIVLLPLDSFLFAWELNCVFITVTATLVVAFIVSYVPIIFLLMDHSCWLIDIALVTAEDLNECLLLDEDPHNPEQAAKTYESLKKLVGRCETFVEWQSEVQDLLFWSSKCKR